MMMVVGQIDDSSSFDFEGQISAPAGMDIAHAYSELLIWSLAINTVFFLPSLHTYLLSSATTHPIMMAATISPKSLLCSAHHSTAPI